METGLKTRVCKYFLTQPKKSWLQLLRPTIWFDLQFRYFSPKIMVISKKKKGLHFDLISNFAIKKRSSSIFFLRFRKFRPKTQLNSKIIIMNLMLPKYFTLYIIYKKLAATPRIKQNDPLKGRDPQVENHWLIRTICRQIN